jgi:hypothetical protein
MTDIITPATVAAMLEGVTPGPWSPHNMIHEEGRPMTPEEIGEYVANAVRKGSADRFLFVSGLHDDGGDADICHTGNGPRAIANARFIAWAREAVPALAAKLAEAQESVHVVLCEHIETLRNLAAAHAENGLLRAMLTPPDDLRTYTPDYLTHNDDHGLPGDMPMVPGDIVNQLIAEVARLREALRTADLNAQALAEIKASVDGQSDQPVRDIVYGLLDELAALQPKEADHGK